MKLIRQLNQKDHFEELAFFSLAALRVDKEFVIHQITNCNIYLLK